MTTKADLPEIIEMSADNITGALEKLTEATTAASDLITHDLSNCVQRLTPTS